MHIKTGPDRTGSDWFGPVGPFGFGLLFGPIFMTINLTKVQDFFMQHPLFINKVGHETHIVYVLDGSPCVRSKGKPSTMDKTF